RPPSPRDSIGRSRGSRGRSGSGRYAARGIHERSPAREARGGASTLAAMDFETRAIHAGQEPDPATGSVTTPVYLTSTYVQDEVGVHKGYDYSRVQNPTRKALEECLASLEDAGHGLAFSSGLGATTTIMHLVSPGDRVVSVDDVFGGVYRMFSQTYAPKCYEFGCALAAEI